MSYPGPGREPSRRPNDPRRPEQGWPDQQRYPYHDPYRDQPYRYQESYPAYPQQAYSDPYRPAGHDYRPEPTAAPPQPERNGFATAGLVLGILPTVVYGLVFSILGLVRAGKVGRGRVRAWFGIVLSLAWVYPCAISAARLDRAADPGCVTVKALLLESPLGRQWSHEASINAMTADTRALVAQLQTAAARSDRTAVRAAITASADDLQGLLAHMSKGTMPTKAETAQSKRDFAAIDNACGI